VLHVNTVIFYRLCISSLASRVNWIGTVCS